MQAVFVGSARGVGASCLAIELGGQWIVVDVIDQKALAHEPDLFAVAGLALNAGDGFAVELGGQRLYVWEVAQQGMARSPSIRRMPLCD
jgi:hypothetical protein